MIPYDLQQIKAIVFDVDGVLSSNCVAMDLEGQPLRTLNIKDGYAIQLAAKQKLRLAIITGGYSEALRKRYEYLGVRDIFMRSSVKINDYERFLQDSGLTDAEVVYVGDDIPDYEIMQRVGCAVCPADAAPEIKMISCYVSPYRGGEGVARDVIEQILKAKGLWMSDKQAFGW